MSMMVRRNVALSALAATLTVASAVQAGSQSSNTSSNSSSNNGVVRERVIDTYCDGGYCQRFIDQRIYHDDPRTRWRGGSERRRYRHDLDD